MKQSKRIAFCGMTAALGTVVLLLGDWIGIGAYVAPMLAGLVLIPAGRQWGRRWQLLLWAAVGLLGLILLSDLEESLMFLCFFGWYPVLRPRLEKLPRGLRWTAKLAVFNALIVALELVLMCLLVPEDLGAGLLAVLLALGNVVFVIYDRLIPMADQFYDRRLRRLL